MKTRIFILGLMMFVVNITSAAFRLESSFSDSIKPVRTIEQDDTGITVSYEFPGAIAIQDELYPEATNLSIPGFGINSEPEDNVIIRIRPVNSTLNIIKEISTSGGFETISMRNFDKGVYIIELIEDGILVDYKKVSI